MGCRPRNRQLNRTIDIRYGLARKRRHDFITVLWWQRPPYIRNEEAGALVYPKRHSQALTNAADDMRLA